MRTQFKTTKNRITRPGTWSVWAREIGKGAGNWHWCGYFDTKRAAREYIALTNRVAA